MQDTAEIFLEELKKEKLPEDIHQEVEELLEDIRECQPGTIALIHLVREIQEGVDTLAVMMRDHAGIRAGAAYWARQLERQVTAWGDLIDRYLLWMEMLAERSEEEIAETGLNELLILRRNLEDSPSLSSLALGNVDGISNCDPEQIKSKIQGRRGENWVGQFNPSTIY